MQQTVKCLFDAVYSVRRWSTVLLPHTEPAAPLDIAVAVGLDEGVDGTNMGLGMMVVGSLLS